MTKRSRKKKTTLDAGRAVEGGAEMDMTPMIDITFQLIVFFLVANDLTQKEIEELELPQALAGIEDTAPEDRRVIVNVLAPDNPADPNSRPRIRVRGKSYESLEALTRHLRIRADEQRDEDGALTPSEVFVLVRADRGTPWRHVQHVMQACADESVRIYKVQFATTQRDDGLATSVGDAITD